MQVVRYPAGGGQLRDHVDPRKNQRVVTNKNVVSVPKGYITDLASVPRFCWAFFAPFDVARAAVVHDILYEKINTAYKGEKILTKHDRERYRKVADDVFKEGMESAVPPVP